MPEPAHTQFRQDTAGSQPAGGVDTGVDHARAGGQCVNGDSKFVGSDGTRVRERPGALVHPKVCHDR